MASTDKLTTGSSLPDYRSSEPDVCAAHIGLVFRRLREIKGMTQSDLAQASTGNLSYMNSIENHSSNIGIKKLIQICNALDIRPHVVLRILECMADSHRLSERPVPAGSDQQKAGARVGQTNPDSTTSRNPASRLPQNRQQDK